MKPFLINITEATGAIILPPLAVSYCNPERIEEICARAVEKRRNPLEVENNIFACWAGKKLHHRKKEVPK